MLETRALEKTGKQADSFLAGRLAIVRARSKSITGNP